MDSRNEFNTIRRLEWQGKFIQYVLYINMKLYGSKIWDEQFLMIQNDIAKIFLRNLSIFIEFTRRCCTREIPISADNSRIRYNNQSINNLYRLNKLQTEIGPNKDIISLSSINLIQLVSAPYSCCQNSQLFMNNL